MVRKLKIAKENVDQENYFTASYGSLKKSFQMATKTQTNGTTTTNGQLAADKKAAREEMQAKRLSDLEKENRAQSALLKQHTRQLELMKKEKDSMQADYNRTVLVK